MDYVIEAKQRESGNKGLTKKLREQGEIPAVVYGNDKEPVSFYINQRSFRKQFTHISESTLITLNIEGQDSKSVLIKDYVENLIRNTIDHIDFYEVSKGKSLTTNVSVVLTGTPAGAIKGGVLEHLEHEVEIECIPADLPEQIELDISAMDLGDSLYVSNLPKLKGVTYRSSDEQLIVHLSAPKQASLEPDLDDGIVEEEDEE